MDILKALGVKIKNKSRFTKISLIIAASAFGAGLILKAFVKTPDHPIEQLLETVLKTQGIDHDFSEDEKSKKAGR